jgi:hypothetical protein
MDALQRFMKNIEMIPESGCWIWAASTYPDGRYGKFYMGPKDYDGSHRAAWRLFKGPIPEGAYVCHRCDVTLCGNPFHLFLGDAQANMTDKVEKKRHRCPKGEGQWKAKLTEDDVRHIRKMHAKGATQRSIAEHFGMTFQGIWDIVHRKNWKNVE